MRTPFHIVFAVYPRVTQLDFTGPFEVLARAPGARCVVASAMGADLEADGGLVFTGVKKLSDVTACDLLCVPGGYGVVDAMEDAIFLDEVRRLAGMARYVTSVCTGSLALGAAGLLKGKRAACHWAWRDLLAPFGAVADPARVVRDGNIFSGGGVTAGIDLALTVLAELAGQDFAEAVQLSIEYAPAPPFASGRPEEARPEVLERVRRRVADGADLRRAAAQRAGARLA